MSRRRRSDVHGVLVVDKPSGPTSHDVVARARRALRTSAVGHAGTLDPMATGVLVLAVGEGTKLVPYLTADDKAYEAELRMGVATDSLDADGAVVDEKPVPACTLEDVRSVAARFVGEKPQRAPAVSAIRVGGERLHEKVRRGETVEAPIRTVVLHRLEIQAVDGDRIRMVVECGKGFYVRSLARDIAEALGTVGHLTALRRTRSGAFHVEDAFPGTALFPPEVGDAPTLDARARVLSLPDACRAFSPVALTESGVVDASHGRPIDASGLASGAMPEAASPLALYAPDGRVVAMARIEEGRVRVLRGFRTPPPAGPSVAEEAARVPDAQTTGGRAVGSGATEARAAGDDVAGDDTAGDDTAGDDTAGDDMAGDGTAGDGGG